MNRTLLALGAAGVFVAACDTVGPRGIASLGRDFVQMFEADANAEPVDAQDVALTLTPRREPFNP